MLSFRHARRGRPSRSGSITRASPSGGDRGARAACLGENVERSGSRRGSSPGGTTRRHPRPLGDPTAPRRNSGGEDEEGRVGRGASRSILVRTRGSWSIHPRRDGGRRAPCRAPFQRFTRELAAQGPSVARRRRIACSVRSRSPRPAREDPSSRLRPRAGITPSAPRVGRPAHPARDRLVSARAARRRRAVDLAGKKRRSRRERKTLRPRIGARCVEGTTSLRDLEDVEERQRGVEPPRRPGRARRGVHVERVREPDRAALAKPRNRGRPEAIEEGARCEGRASLSRLSRGRPGRRSRPSAPRRRSARFSCAARDDLDRRMTPRRRIFHAREPRDHRRRARRRGPSTRRGRARSAVAPTAPSRTARPGSPRGQIDRQAGSSGTSHDSSQTGFASTSRSGAVLSGAGGSGILTKDHPGGAAAWGSSLGTILRRWRWLRPVCSSIRRGSTTRPTWGRERGSGPSRTS
jgi:hypothetical protein